VALGDRERQLTAATRSMATLDERLVAGAARLAGRSFWAESLKTVAIILTWCRT
jgi:hypothetical protein